MTFFRDPRLYQITVLAGLLTYGLTPSTSTSASARSR